MKPSQKKQSPSPSAEHALLTSLKPYLNYAPSSRYPIPIGDDAAIRVCTSGEKLIFTTDTHIENTHFSKAYMSLDTIGYRAMMVNLSDCAAMGAAPDGALISLTLGKTDRDSHSSIKEIYKGIYRACTEFNVSIIGGDISQGPVLALCITMIGRIAPGHNALLRTGAKATDNLWVSGQPGTSAAGFDALTRLGRTVAKKRFPSLVAKHCTPAPRVALGCALSQSSLVHSMIDISDGISKECSTLAHENTMGIILDAGSLSISAPMRRLGDALTADPLQWYLHGGEEYELLFAASPTFIPSAKLRSLVPLTKIGSFSNKSVGVTLRFPDGTTHPLPNRSFDHLS